MSFTQFFVLLLFNCKQQLDKQIKVPTFKIVSVEQVHNTSSSIQLMKLSTCLADFNQKAYDS